MASFVARGWRMPRPAYREAALPCLALFLVYAVSVAVVGVSGDFPLNDDWAFLTTTRDFVRTGTFIPSGWSSIPIVSEALFAAPFCMLSHCGSDDLRLATLLAAVLLFSATFALARSAPLARSGAGNNAIAATAAILVAFNPVAYALSFTFMTDILFAAFLVAGAWSFLRALERESAALLVLATLLTLAATLTRQLGLCLALAYLVVRVVAMLRARRWRWRVPLAALPLLLCGAALLLLKHWLVVSGRLPALYDAKSNDLVNTLKSPLGALLRVGHNTSIIVLYMGLFTLPMTLFTRRPAAAVATPAPRWTRWLPTAAAGALTLLAAADLATLHRLMPAGGNILIAQGIGPLFLRDVAVLGLPDVPPLPTAFWLIVTLLSLLGGFLLVERLARQIVDLLARPWRGPLDAARTGRLFALVALLSYFAPLLLISFYDRYLIPMLPIALYLLASGPADPLAGPWPADPLAGPWPAARWRATFATVLCVLISVYAVLAVHDYMAWNRARWRAIADLELSKGIAASRIDGGMEYNGLRAYRPDYVAKDGKSWWWIDRDDYQITFDAIPGMAVAGAYPYRTWLPPATRSIKVLTRENAAD
jgi:hypothetical protein